MTLFHLPASKETPEILIDRERRHFAMSGESYPENAMLFYGPVRNELADLLAQPTVLANGLEAHFNLRYFNSSSTKLIRALVAMLHRRAESGSKILALWHHDPEDDMMAEFGEDLREEFNAIDFRLVETELA